MPKGRKKPPVRRARTGDRRTLAALEHELERLRASVSFLGETRTRLAALNERLGLLARLALDLPSPDADAVLDLAVEKTARLLGVRFVSIYLRDETRDVLVRARHTHGYEIDAEVDPAAADGPLARAIRSLETFYTRNLDEPVASPPERPFAARYKTASCIVIPLRWGTHLLGALSIADREDGAPLDELQDLATATQLATLLSATLWNCHLYDEVRRRGRTDGLTGLLNATAFADALRGEVARVRRHGGTTTVLVCDVKGLSAVNRAHGHATGDEVLRAIAGLLGRMVRASDVVGRTGGDAFGLILPSTPESGGAVLGRRIETAVAALKLSHGDSALAPRSVCGVAEWQAGETPDHLFARAEAFARGKVADGA